MPRLPSAGESVTLSSHTAFALCDGLLKMAHCMIVELPEPELRDIRYTLDALLIRTDQVLDMVERDFSLIFNGLRVDPSIPPGAEDFGAVLVSTTSATGSTDFCDADSSFSSCCPNTTSNPAPGGVRFPPPVPTTSPALPHATTSAIARRLPTPIPSLAPAPTQVPSHGRYPLIISSRDNIKFPDYTDHPYFVRPGIPGAYQRPPVSFAGAENDTFYVVSQGLYVGIFTEWCDVVPWVIGIPGSVFRKATSWDEARDTYNARLACGVVKVLA
ncbi:hypothetical protein BJ322DRAFT_1112323 [Thelephora terrestris]|uniref:Ribonuclease H1 N-terminal domain-containing protein n=1 Tax=Thelephora terrestris TaxID=56493 RepID=A0A9P6L3Q3_9AGAM|nr:hypothetical protein BJ322DRAFT_1112323 [Thelephora terrestris]